MAVDAKKVLAYLDEKYKGKGPKAFREKQVQRWAERIEDEDGIADFVEDRAADFLDAVAEADRRSEQTSRNVRAELARQVAGEEEGSSTTTEPTTTAPEGTPDWAKVLFTQVGQLGDKVNGFEKTRAAETVADTFAKAAKAAGIPEFHYEGRTPATAEEVAGVVDKLKTSYDAFATQHKLGQFGKDNPLPVGGGSAATGTGKVDPDVASFASKKNEAFTTKN